ncbi:hypothetical protein [Mycoavidus sp. B2-EB]|uniref:hypothetical protein n=1 Tax=Mycoavidus sp. B2-EB TaxID=2651972 RepID=UPI00162A2AB7|nr:hypothetical protein [Mycoavidus sp. B2-EB]BBO59067.1 hypothetical protein MPB2EB_0168 [Mycoavidus sp. B2-EB]
MSHEPNQTEVLLRQMSDMDKLAERVSELCAQVADLTENAARDPKAQERLAKLQREWADGNSNVPEQIQQIQTHMQRAIACSEEYTQTVRAEADKSKIADQGAGSDKTAGKKARQFA